MSDLCPTCGGYGGFDHPRDECCGNYLDTGECCAAKYGTAYVVQTSEFEPCPECGGSGKRNRLLDEPELADIAAGAPTDE